MSLFDNIVEVLQEFKNDIISSLKNEIINLKQEIINLNREKDEEINILKQELLRTRKELEQSENEKNNYKNTIIKLEEENNKLITQIPHNNLFPKIAEKCDAMDFIKKCIFHSYTNNTPCPSFTSYEELKRHYNIRDKILDDDEYVIWFDHCMNRQFRSKYKSLITNRGKIFVMYDKYNYNLPSIICYYCCNLKIKIMNQELFELIKKLCLNIRNFDNTSDAELYYTPCIQYAKGYNTDI